MRDPNYTPTPTPLRTIRPPSPSNNSSSSSSSGGPHHPPSSDSQSSTTPPPKPKPQPLPLRILTHNIRYATPTPSRGELPWPQRLPHLLAELHYHTRGQAEAIICLQEVLHGQLEDILTGLNGGLSRRRRDNRGGGGSSSSSSGAVGDEEEEEEWAHYGRGRDDGAQAGEYSPILYRAAGWERRAARTVWLSPTPGVPGSKGWDAASVRICGGVVLEARGRGESASASASGQGQGEGERERRRRRRILVLNTHLDDQGRRSRIEGAKIILREIQKTRREWRDRGGIDAVVLSGDLNSDAPATEERGRSGIEEEEEEEDAYTVLNAPGSGLRDIRPSIPPERRYGHEMTFTGFDGRGDGDARCRRIDFIHVDVGSGASVNVSDGNGDRDGDTDGVEGPTRHYRREAENTSEDLDRDEANANANAKRIEEDAASPWHIAGYTVLPNRFDDGVYMSDHRAVVGDLLLR